jgi:Fe-S-cluster containining protein
MGTISSTEFLCVRCAALFKTCCREREIYITLADTARITAFCNRNDFTEWCTPSDPAYSDQSDDPVWDRHVFRNDRRRRILLRTSSGDCTFLGSTGCILPETVRPLVCRLHPYTYTAAGIDAEPASDCPRCLVPEGMTVFDALNMSTEQALLWHRMLYEEILLENDNDNRTNI